MGSWQGWTRRLKGLRQETYALLLACRDERTPWYAKLTAAVVVAYAFSPIDLIPDFIPVIGLLDDMVLVPLGVVLDGPHAGDGGLPSSCRIRVRAGQAGQLDSGCGDRRYMDRFGIPLVPPRSGLVLNFRLVTGLGADKSASRWHRDDRRFTIGGWRPRCRRGSRASGSWRGRATGRRTGRDGPVEPDRAADYIGMVHQPPASSGQRLG